MLQHAANGGPDMLSSMERLIQAVLTMWAEQGHAAISTRLLAQAAGLPVSSIYHHFGSLDHLYLAAQGHARAAAEAWCAARIDEIATPRTLAPQALPSLLAAMIDDWSHGQRRLALAWRECYMLAARDERYLPALASWRILWADFCREICARCGVAEFGEATSLFFDGESLLHLTRWRRAVDRAGLDETCAGWARWLDGALAPEGPWRRFAREEALHSMPPVPIPNGAAETIAAAAANIVEQRGIAGLTHRAVAAEAGLTLGIVSHNFHTSADLARVAFEMVYRRVVSAAERDAPVPPVARPTEGAISVVAFRVTSAKMLALDELLLAVVRRTEFQAFTPQLRYLRGRSSGPLLQSLLGPAEPVSPLDAALFSVLLSGLKRACLGRETDEAQTYAHHVLDPLLQKLGR